MLGQIVISWAEHLCALGSGERVLYTAERPAFLAKNRFGLPDVLPLDWQAFAAAMPQT